MSVLGLLWAPYLGSGPECCTSSGKVFLVIQLGETEGLSSGDSSVLSHIQGAVPTCINSSDVTRTQVALTPLRSLLELGTEAYVKSYFLGPIA